MLNFGATFPEPCLIWIAPFIVTDTSPDGLKMTGSRKKTLVTVLLLSR